MQQSKWTKVDEKDWSDKPLVVLGAGPSAAGLDFKAITDRCDVRVLAVKETVFDAPNASACIGMDHAWLWKRHVALRQQNVPVFAAVNKNQVNSYPDVEGITYILREDNVSLSENPNVVHCCGDSGSVALNFATLRGAREILAVGFDYKLQDPAEYRQGHHYNDKRYPWFCSYNCKMFDIWAERLDNWADDFKRVGVKLSVAGNVDSTMLRAYDLVDSADWLQRYLKKEVA